jgi:hypothetical protein
MTSLPKELLAVINRINDNVVSDLKSKDATDPLLPYFLANGRAYYNNLFMPVMMEEVKAERRGKSQGSNSKNERRGKSQGTGAKKLQETIEVSTTGLNRKLTYKLFTERPN